MISVENKIPSVIILVKNTDYDAKVASIESKYITTADNNKLTKDIVQK